MKKLIVIAACAMCMVGGYAVGQEAWEKSFHDIDPAVAEAYRAVMVEVQMNATFPDSIKYEQGPYHLVQMYDAATRNKQLTRYILYRQAAAHRQGTQNATETSAELAFLQAAQNERLIEQNDKIIALLEKIAAQKENGHGTQKKS